MSRQRASVPEPIGSPAADDFTKTYTTSTRQASFSQPSLQPSGKFILNRWWFYIRRRRIFSRSIWTIVLYGLVVVFLMRTFILWSNTLPSAASAGGDYSLSGGLNYILDQPIVQKSKQLLSSGQIESASKPVSPEPVSDGKVKSRSGHKLKDGILHVDTLQPTSQHPIYQLMRDAKRDWNAKIARQSTTLEEAVVEYRRRNHRNPPLGFDKWWEYVQKHNVPLPDEYDQINKDLSPFRAFTPTVLRARTPEARDLTDTFTFSVSNGVASIDHVTFDPERITGAEKRMKDQLHLLKDVAKHIPDFESVYSIHDRPTRLMSHAHRSDLLETADDGEYFDDKTLVETHQDDWSVMCGPMTNINTAGFSKKISSAKSFIYSHSIAMDICTHPSLTLLHGAFISGNPNTQPKAIPIFSLSKTPAHADILGIPTDYWESTSEDPLLEPWSAKTDARLVWRGKNTGGQHSNAIDWKSMHRLRLPGMAKHDDPTMVNVMSSPKMSSYMGADLKLKDSMKRVKAGPMNKRMTDIALSLDEYLDTPPEAIQCNVEQGICAEIANNYPFATFVRKRDEPTYKYLLDIDGNAWSARFKRSLNTGSLVFKSTVHVEFWNDRIQPWLHYVPVKVDYSDLYDILVFFRGDNEKGTNGEDTLAAKIAEGGLNWSHTHWREEDMTAYLFRLYLEYARLTAKNRSKADFKLPKH
ncbi:Endoplasmic reticulum protein EP58, contains filamin rod domain and KDEL motif [Phaffia rhodozyma]|uniref:Endoplasmic reticulum protein EP58, contains filamin rod domain and KDEL motif n=1 Tax=Phaffia rhodozyma TaxID=264483 RepID=A0A0F7SLZ7_PHARH|nr:Endoplasmic reticulum protein EP58, contains filamin rod domain and KDEL motif [Phaffia rhodozyma]